MQILENLVKNNKHNYIKNTLLNNNIMIYLKPNGTNFYFEKINFINHFIILLMEPLKNFQANSFFYVVIDLKYYYAN